MKQTSKTNTDYIFIPKGTRVEAKASAVGSSYVDLGSVDGDVEIPVTYDSIMLQDNSASILKRYIKNMKVNGKLTLMDIDPVNVVLLSGGTITSVATPASANSAIPVQSVPAGWADHTVYELIAYESASVLTKLKLPTKPVLTSVVIATDTTPETLVEVGSAAAGDYVVVADSRFTSGWGIVFNSDGMTVGSPTTRIITITWGTNTPTARTTMHFGSANAIFAPYSLRFTCLDSALKTRGFEIYSSTTDSGGIAFTAKSALSDGTETLPVAFTGEIDTSRTDGQQLFNWWIDEGMI